MGHCEQTEITIDYKKIKSDRSDLIKKLNKLKTSIRDLEKELQVIKYGKINGTFKEEAKETTINIKKYFNLCERYYNVQIEILDNIINAFEENDENTSKAMVN